MRVWAEETSGLFGLETKTTSYVIGVADGKYVGHVYYGKKLENEKGIAHLLRTQEPPFVPSVNLREKGSFMDVFPWEYPVWGLGDYREACLMVRTQQGHRACEPVYTGYRILEGKPKPEGLPATFEREGAGARTLEIDCEDPVTGLQAVLCYSVFEDSDALIRSVRLSNRGTEPLYIEKALSAGFDLDAGEREFEMLTLTGSWARERCLTRCPVTYGRHGAASVRGVSSHQEQPFLALLSPGASQDGGEVYAMHFIYSGNFLAFAQRDQHGTVRMAVGIHPDGFEWVLEPGGTFQTPEAACVYSDEGLGKMSRTFHDLYRSHLIRSRYLHRKRPVLLNCWEAVYFDFDEEKLVKIAREAAKDGIGLLVLDDGWFGCRSSDEGSLGDWEENREKLPGGLPALAKRIKAEGLSLGIWFEPEMVSPDSKLYRMHPDWALQVPGREPVQSRAQYVLDLSRQEVVDYVYECVARILRSADISYLKWDMNRQLSDVGNCLLPAGQQGELFHRYMLGVYQLQERLTAEFPELLLENCCSGGGRFDPGMLYYSPQIWCSDNTDAAARLAIQEGTALLYPLSCIGSHVSACPNHMVGRMTPPGTRGYVALAGTFGYELDITKLAEDERKAVREQVKLYHTYADLIREGDYYCAASYQENRRYSCWEAVAKDKSEVLAACVQVLAEANRRSIRICLKGLDPKADYRLDYAEGSSASEYGPKTGRIFGGAALMYGGILIPAAKRDFEGVLLHLTRE